MLGLVTYSLILSLLAIGSWRRPAIAVAAVLTLYGLKQWGQDSSAILSSHREITNYAVGAIALLAVILATLRRSCLFCRVPAVAILIATLYAYAFATLAWSPDLTTSLDQWKTQGPYIVTMALLAPLVLDNVYDVRTALMWTALCGTAICILMLAFGHWGYRGLIVYGDLADNETNPLALASLAGTVTLIAALSMAPPQRALSRIIAAACIPVTLAVILKSGSRGQLLATIAGLIMAWPIAFPLRDGRSRRMLVVTGAVVVALAWWASTLVNLDASRWSGANSQGDVLGRLDNAGILLQTAAASPATTIFGLGNSSAFHILGIYPHITALEVLAEEGFVGLCMYAAVIVLTLRTIKRLAVHLRDEPVARARVAMLAGLFTFELVLSQKEGSLLSSVYVFLYAIALGRIEAQALHTEYRATHDSLSTSSPAIPNLMR